MDGLIVALLAAALMLPAFLVGEYRAWRQRCQRIDAQLRLGERG